MKNPIPFLALTALASQPLSAALSAYESFDSSLYNLGANANSADYGTDDLATQGSGTASGFTGTWLQSPTLNSGGGVYWATNGGTSSADNYLRADGGQASYTDTNSATLATQAGQASYQTSLGTPNQVSLERSFTYGTTGSPKTFYVSTLVTIDGSAGVSFNFQSAATTDHRPFQFGVTEGGDLFARGRQSGSTGEGFLTETTGYGPGTYLLVARFSDKGTSADTIEIWVNPLLESALGTPNLKLTNSFTNFYVGDNPSYSVDGLVVDFNSSGATTGTTSVDEIRIGTTYASVVPVVPEPSTALLGALGALCLLRRKR